MSRNPVYPPTNPGDVIEWLTDITNVIKQTKGTPNWFDNNTKSIEELIQLVESGAGGGSKETVLKSIGGYYYKVSVNDMGRLTTERVDATDKLRSVSLVAGNGNTFTLGVTDDGNLTTEQIG